ncbi:MAG: hypothetical protein Q8N23_02915 [Archangium sp.]|nr:hypothetical protein [Archangium sp.]MDP3151593.1 hypothetical protein [Archangium sp.]MDP3569128.1 hypothetical protein [Archangium sp.]
MELRAHVKQCALCRHELNWLETESAMFRQRAGRDEVAELWKGVEKRRGLSVEPRSWPRVLVAMAAAAVLLVMVGRAAPQQTSMATDSFSVEETLESSMLASPAFLFFEPSEPCSKLPSGVGFQCSPVVPASFLASR